MFAEHGSHPRLLRANQEIWDPTLKRLSICLLQVALISLRPAWIHSACEDCAILGCCLWAETCSAGAKEEVMAAVVTKEAGKRAWSGNSGRTPYSQTAASWCHNELLLLSSGIWSFKLHFISLNTTRSHVSGHLCLYLLSKSKRGDFGWSSASKASLRVKAWSNSWFRWWLELGCGAGSHGVYERLHKERSTSVSCHIAKIMKSH